MGEEHHHQHCQEETENQAEQSGKQDEARYDSDNVVEEPAEYADGDMQYMGTETIASMHEKTAETAKVTEVKVADVYKSRTGKS